MTTRIIDPDRDIKLAKQKNAVNFIVSGNPELLAPFKTDQNPEPYRREPQPPQPEKNLLHCFACCLNYIFYSDISLNKCPSCDSSRIQLFNLNDKHFSTMLKKLEAKKQQKRKPVFVSPKNAKQKRKTSFVVQNSAQQNKHKREAKEEVVKI